MVTVNHYHGLQVRSAHTIGGNGNGKVPIYQQPVSTIYQSLQTDAYPARNRAGATGAEWQERLESAEDHVALQKFIAQFKDGDHCPDGGN